MFTLCTDMTLSIFSLSIWVRKKPNLSWKKKNLCSLYLECYELLCNISCCLPVMPRSCLTPGKPDCLLSPTLYLSWRSRGPFLLLCCSSSMSPTVNKAEFEPSIMLLLGSHLNCDSLGLIVTCSWPTYCLAVTWDLCTAIHHLSAVQTFFCSTFMLWDDHLGQSSCSMCLL